MNARDVMSTPVITVSPDTTVKRIVELLTSNRISGVVVVDRGQVVGTVGDGDLIHRYEIGTDVWKEDRPWWRRLVEGRFESLAYVKAHGCHARDVMSYEVITVQVDESLERLSHIFQVRSVRRIPVLAGDNLVGVVTRADLVRAMARAIAPVEVTPWTSDEMIREALVAELVKQPWWSSTASQVTVHMGVVRYVGGVERDCDKDAARIAAENIPGVRRVEDLRYSFEAMPQMF